MLVYVVFKYYPSNSVPSRVSIYLRLIMLSLLGIS